VYGLVPVFKNNPRLVGRLGSGVWVSARFQIFALTVGGMSWVGRELVQGKKMSTVECPTITNGLQFTAQMRFEVVDVGRGHRRELTDDSGSEMIDA